MPFDPKTVTIEADLSRADVQVLHDLCAGKPVVEFGAGGSTVLLARCAGRVTSYEPDPRWWKLARDRLNRETEPTCTANVVHLPACAAPPPDAPKAGVYFIDGPPEHRPAWVREAILRKLAPVIVVHDSRRPDLMSGLEFLTRPPVMLKLESLEWHARQSNMLVIRVRNQPVRWSNWNLTERNGRAPHLHMQGPKPK